MTTDTPTTAKVFFSWQSDTASRENRSLIEWALNRAIKILKADVDVSEADRSLAIDRDTIDTPGMPPVADTIFKKIDEAAIFVSDLTYVAFRARGEGIPNPNVLLEHGWALKSKGWPQVVGLMNTAYGHPKTHPLPFDLLHSRWPILYNCPAGADDAVRNAAREELAAVLVKALKLSIADDGFGASALGPHPHDVALLDRLRKLIPDRIHNFLVTHSFGTPFPRALLDPLFALRFEWIGARHEFHDRKLQAALETVREANEAFYSLVDTHVSATENRSDWCTAKPQEIPNETSRQAMYAAIKALDGTASRLAETLDAFERVARHRIRAEPAAGQVVDTTAEATKAFEAAWRVHPPAIVSQPPPGRRLVRAALSAAHRTDHPDRPAVHHRGHVQPQGRGGGGPAAGRPAHRHSADDLLPCDVRGQFPDGQADRDRLSAHHRPGLHRGLEQFRTGHCRRHRGLRPDLAGRLRGRHRPVGRGASADPAGVSCAVDGPTLVPGYGSAGGRGLMVVLHLLDADDVGLIAALRGAGLPEPGAGRYFAAHEHGGIAGYVGLEGEGQDLLLRSLVVLADLKAQGIGSRILTAVEAMASDLRSERLHLLTTTAELFFARHGFVVADRASAPPAIRRTREFADVCPASAAYLIKDL
ncbi:GNAT family N-acetyltransferase [Brevundimonas sanguinis]|uniref:GNAT family N-acetyltransferase n=1 Tax=Brevundimonas sanguinis TaxID=3021811 RepID=UPI00406BA8DD